MLSLAVLTVGFDPAAYSVQEGSEISLRLVLSLETEREVTVGIATLDETAIGA